MCFKSLGKRAEARVPTQPATSRPSSFHVNSTTFLPLLFGGGLVDRPEVFACLSRTIDVSTPIIMYVG